MFIFFLFGLKLPMGFRMRETSAVICGLITGIAALAMIRDLYWILSCGNWYTDSSALFSGLCFSKM